jgi:hypothetical protein
LQLLYGKQFGFRCYLLVNSSGDNLTDKGEFLALEPLNNADRRCSNVFVVEFDMTSYGIQIGVGKGLSKDLFIKALSPPERIGHDLIAKIELPDRLCPFFSGRLFLRLLIVRGLDAISVDTGYPSMWLGSQRGQLCDDS